MRHILLLILITLTLESVGQIDPTGEVMLDPNYFNKWNLGVDVSFDLGFRALIDNANSETSSSIISSRNDMEFIKPGFTTGVNVIRNLSKKWSLVGGISYSRKGYSSKMDNLVFGDMIDPRTGFIYDTPESERFDAVQFNYHMNYIDVPIKATYLLGKQENDYERNWYLGLGVINSYFINEVVTSKKTLDGKKVGKDSNTGTANFNKFMFSPAIYFGTYRLNAYNHQLRIEANFKYGVTEIIDTNVSATLWSAGISIGYYLD
jgi:hypothetical protein